MKDVRAEMGQRLAKLRDQYKLTQEQMAEKLGVTAKHVSAVERGLSSYSVEKLVKAAMFFDCSMDFLFYGDDINHHLSAFPATVINILCSDNEKEIRLLMEYLSMYSRIRRSSTD